MAPSLGLLLAGMSIASAAKDYAKRGGHGCAFTLSSDGTLACPAGQLEDGQIRLNGSESTATFYLQDGGGFKDSDVFGCIVTEEPITQVQCDDGKEADAGFSIESSKLLYHGSPDFFACPATDTEWNVYVKPDFGQTKCMPITLTVSGCSTPSSLSCEAAPAQTKTVTVTTTDMTTFTTSILGMWNTTRPCRICTKTTTTVAPANSSSSTKSCHRCGMNTTATDTAPPPHHVSSALGT